ncbi:MAG: hypothetical protein ACQET5_17010 [Halobacteriota archaeon]
MGRLCVDDDPEFVDLTTAVVRRNLPAATLRPATRVTWAQRLTETKAIACIAREVACIAREVACIAREYAVPAQNGLEFTRASAGGD